ncbi:hypothetical protein DUT91_14875 [Phyllobacterium salinisoli]|uniref:Uncharacterized protein n=1 Tax=Phyllobacterium salinisoli TaxID=1899321 RepID=A0A368K072_9HYPH|nr:hypothetical protein [Phyllobacterium salinisoli]RCS22789.1 hypothetical protein DUT91_14875 [Phyllobacterium salinisoli]
MVLLVARGTSFESWKSDAETNAGFGKFKVKETPAREAATHDGATISAKFSSEVQRSEDKYSGDRGKVAVWVDSRMAG